MIMTDAVDAGFSHLVSGAGELRPEAGDDVSDLVRMNRIAQFGRVAISLS